MDIDIKIGRGVEGTNVCRVPLSYTKASRSHATLHWHDGVVTIEDNGSTNGTYVNGNRTTQALIQENDIVWLGGDPRADSQCYQLDLRKLFAECREIENSQRRSFAQAHTPPPQQPAAEIHRQYSVSENALRTDYSKEFAHVKKAYIEYHEQMSKLSKKANSRMQLPRLLLSLIPTVLGLVVLLVATDMTIRIVAMSAGGVLSGIIGMLTMGKSNSKKEKLAEDILDLQLKYQKEYKCPKCGKEFNLDLHWKKLQAEGKCPYGCGAKYV